VSEGSLAKAPRSSDALSRIIVVSANSSWALTNYRIGLLRALQAAGYSLVAAVPDDETASKLRDEGVEVRSMPIDPHGTSPLAELRLLDRYVVLLRELKPTAFLGFTIKPNIYGSLAGRLTGVPAINNVTGLGVVFSKAGPLRTFVSGLYRIAFRGSHRAFFQNSESRDLFLSLGIVRADQAALLPGSGIDLKRFAPRPGNEKAGSGFIFLLPTRLLWQKGVGEYCEAARLLRQDFPAVRFQLVGPIEPASNKGAIPSAQIDKWQKQGIDYLGSVEDVRPLFAAADCIVLPSYYQEGVPRTLIEAAAMGKPIITTDMPGCRDVVEQGVTGLLCEPMAVDSLVLAMKQMIERSAEERGEMGRLARLKAEREFDERLVIEAYLAAIESIASK
jgi:glycosyltransferase involved in cell wall biosynthesis